MSSQQRAFWQIQFCVLLWGFTAILGKLINMPAHALVIWRMAMVCVLLMAWPRLWKHLRAMTIRQVLTFAGIGAVVALHWLTFYGAIKLSNASVAASCLALGSIFAALIEPLLTSKSWSRSEMILGVLAIPGVLLLLGGVPLSMHTGVWVGIASAFLTALFSVLNKRFVHAAEPAAMAFIELAFGGVFLLIVSAVFLEVTAVMKVPVTRDLLLLLVLALFCTLLPFVLSLHAMRHISAFDTQLALNLEPVYAIVIAAIWLGETKELTPQFYLGAFLIVSLVLVKPALSCWRSRQSRAIDSNWNQ